MIHTRSILCAILFSLSPVIATQNDQVLDTPCSKALFHEPTNNSIPGFYRNMPYAVCLSVTLSRPFGEVDMYGDSFYLADGSHWIALERPYQDWQFPIQAGHSIITIPTFEGDITEGRYWVYQPYWIIYKKNEQEFGIMRAYKMIDLGF